MVWDCFNFGAAAPLSARGNDEWHEAETQIVVQKLGLVRHWPLGSLLCRDVHRATAAILVLKDMVQFGCHPDHLKRGTNILFESRCFAGSLRPIFVILFRDDAAHFLIASSRAFGV